MNFGSEQDDKLPAAPGGMKPSATVASFTSGSTSTESIDGKLPQGSIVSELDAYRAELPPVTQANSRRFKIGVCANKNACQVYLAAVDVYNANSPIQVFRASDEVVNPKHQEQIKSAVDQISYPFMTVENNLVEAKPNLKSGKIGIADVSQNQHFFVIQSVAKMYEGKKWVPGQFNATVDCLRSRMISDGFVGSCRAKKRKI
jgi:hypothetical protein